MPSGIRLPSLTMTFRSEPSGFADKTWPLLALRKNKRPERGLATDLAGFDFEFVDDIEFFPSFPIVPIHSSISSRLFIRLAFRQTAQTSLMLRSIVLMTESILP